MWTVLDIYHYSIWGNKSLFQLRNYVRIYCIFNNHLFQKGVNSLNRFLNLFQCKTSYIIIDICGQLFTSMPASKWLSHRWCAYWMTSCKQLVSTLIDAYMLMFLWNIPEITLVSLFLLCCLSFFCAYLPLCLCLKNSFKVWKYMWHVSVSYLANKSFSENYMNIPFISVIEACNRDLASAITITVISSFTLSLNGFLNKDSHINYINDNMTSKFSLSCSVYIYLCTLLMSL